MNRNNDLSNIEGSGSSDKRSIPAYGGLFFEGTYRYTSQITYPVQVRFNHMFPTRNVRYCPADCLNVLEDGVYELSVDITFSAAAVNAILVNTLLNGEKLPEASFYSEYTNAVIGRSARILIPLRRGDEIALEIVSMHHVLKAIVYGANIIIKKIDIIR
jgi:hypothetical protein